MTTLYTLPNYAITYYTVTKAIDPQVVKDMVTNSNPSQALSPTANIMLRPQITWNVVESSQDVWDWSLVDDIADQCMTAGIPILFPLQVQTHTWRCAPYAAGTISGTLASSMTSTDTTFTLQTGQGKTFSKPGTKGLVVLVENEGILVSAISGDTFTVAANGRGYYQNGVAASHSTGAKVVTGIVLPTPQNTAVYAAQLAARYCGQVTNPLTGQPNPVNSTSGKPLVIQAFQMGNEEYDLGSDDVRWTLGTLLANMAAVVYPVIKGYAPQAVVGINAVRKTTQTNGSLHISKWIGDYFARVTSLSGGKSCYTDFVDFHYYRDSVSDHNPANDMPDTTTPSNPPQVPSVYTEYQLISNAAYANGGWRPSIFNLETGWDYAVLDPTGGPNYTNGKDLQSTYLNTMFNAGFTGANGTIPQGQAGCCGIWTIDFHVGANSPQGSGPSGYDSMDIADGQLGIYYPAFTMMKTFIATNPHWPRTPVSSTTAARDLATRLILRTPSVFTKQSNLHTRLIFQDQTSISPPTPTPTSGGGVILSVPSVPSNVASYGIGVYRSLSGGTQSGSGIPTTFFQLADPYSGIYGGQYGFLVDTTIRQPQSVQLTPASEVGLDAVGISVVRGYPQMTWTYNTLRPDYYYYLQYVYRQAAHTPPGYQYLVLIQYFDAGSSTNYSRVLARMDPPTYSSRDVGAYYGVTLLFTYLGQALLKPDTPIQVLSS